MPDLDPLADPQRFLAGLCLRAVAVADPMRVVPQHLPARPEGRLIVVGAGKASARMAERLCGPTSTDPKGLMKAGPEKG